MEHLSQYIPIHSAYQCLICLSMVDIRDIRTRRSKELINSCFHHCTDNPAHTKPLYEVSGYISHSIFIARIARIAGIAGILGIEGQIVAY